MKFTILPYEALENIHFGMSRDEVRELLKNEFNEFIRNEYAALPNDFYKELGLIINYDASFRMEAVEIVSPAEPILIGKDILELSYKSLKKLLSLHDDALEEDETGITSYKLGLCVYAPLKDEDENLPSESVIVFKKGYYDE